jgi:Protein of unknown function (DUF1360)
VSLAVFLLSLGAVARITRFVNSDDLASSVRTAVLRRYGPDSYFYTLLSCPWCLSIWVAAAVVPLAWYCGESAAFQIPAAALSISQLYALAAANWDDS